MEHQELVTYLENSGKDPSRLIFEDELTGLYNRRYLYHVFNSKIVWDSLRQSHISLLMLDLDHFKSINDNYGHHAGDKALIWLSGHLKSVAGSNGMPIRYAGDEFMILLRDTHKTTSLQLGLQLIQNIHNNPFKLENQKDPIKLTISLGVASAPDDANSGKTLIQQADTALYSAKKNGRDQMVNASEVMPTDVFAKTAMYQLNEVQIVGRGRQLSLVADALKKFSLRQSQFLIAEGPAGMGKSEFLETIRRNLARSKTWQTKVFGTPQEMYRPYYLAEKILVDILNQRQDKGAEIFERMTPVEHVYLSRVLPLVGVDSKLIADRDEHTQREELFNTLLKFIPKLVDNLPLIVFIDDLHFGDQATLLLIQGLMIRGDFPLFVCSTATKTQEAGAENETDPLDNFCEAYLQNLGIRKFCLTPLTASDIENHIQVLFPNVHIPAGINEDLAGVTQGNPLFIIEILRKLVADHKITFNGKHWSIQPLEEGYLPKSLEEIVTEKISSLDEDSRRLLDQVSVFGEDVSLSMLIGSSDKMEAKVLEFIDKAAAQGLLNTDFQLNDEVISFLGKRILEITYGAIEPERKEQIHERIGNYQETLYQQKLLPSAATLAYHFKRSTDREKAGIYEQILTTTNNRNFSAEEAPSYSDDSQEEGLVSDVPINPEDAALVPKVIRDFLVAVRNIKLYPPGSKSIIGVISQAKTSLDRILVNNKTFNLMQMKQGLVVNGQKIEASEFKFGAERFLQFLARYELKGIAFHSGLTDNELEALIEAFGRTQEKIIDERYWERFCSEKGLKHIDLKQVRYKMAGKPPLASGEQIPQEKSASIPAGASQPQSTRMDHQGLPLIPAILKGLLGAAKVVKLYPLQSKAVSGAIGKLMDRLNTVLKKQNPFTISHAGNTLLINGDRVDVSEFKTFADGFVKFLDTIGLKSLAFVHGFSRQELEKVIGAFGELPPEGVEKGFWADFAHNQGLSRIFFDKHIYEIRVSQTTQTVTGEQGLGTVTAAPAEEIAAAGQDLVIPEPAAVEEIASESIPNEKFEAYLLGFQDWIVGLFERGADRQVKQAIMQLFLDLSNREIPVREKVITVSRNLVETLQPAFQHDFAKNLTDPLLLEFDQETDPKMTVEMAALLNRLFVCLIEFTNYPPAARIITGLRRRFDQLKKHNDPNAPRLSKSLEIRLNPTTQNLVVADLKSGESTRQRNAAQLLESLGQTAIPLLINILKQEDDYRARQVAATILTKQGPQATKRLKNLLVLEITPEERVRVLDIIDTVTSDLVTELLLALGDENKAVRMAAFRLSERLKTNRVVGILLDNAKSAKGELAVAAVSSLEKLKPPEAIDTLVDILKSTKEEELRMACCRALGRIAKPECIEPLATILSKKSAILRRYNYSPRARATAAFALGQIPQARAVKALAGFVNDPDQRISEIARSVLQKVKLAARPKKAAASAAK
jgi:diguanylate cyclase (GGDEF)-like protein